MLAVGPGGLAVTAVKNLENVLKLKLNNTEEVANMSWRKKDFAAVHKSKEDLSAK
eukprot:m.221953 g.221953  ORF g.221953 m.221953 type:complete len:55 (+) comp39968_c0_seq7:87-251(+)